MNMRIVMVSLGSLLFGCAGGVSTVGATPEEAGRRIAETVCERDVVCGYTNVDCVVGGTCTGVIEPVTTPECLEGITDEAADMVRRFDEAGIEREEIDTCLDQLVAVPCVTESELQAHVDALNAGMTPPSLDRTPEYCRELSERAAE